MTLPSGTTSLYSKMTSDLLRERLRAVPLFAPCNPSDLGVVADRCSVREVPSDTRLIGAGERGSEFFVLLSGSARRGSGATARELGPGDFFGELALLDPAPRAVDVVTTSDSVIGVLSRESFLLVLDAVSGLSTSLLALLARRLRDRRIRDAVVGDDHDAL